MKEKRISEEDSIKHLVILHRVLYGTIENRKALDYLYQHLREDADLADMGRPLKYQYENISKSKMELYVEDRNNLFYSVDLFKGKEGLYLIRAELKRKQFECNQASKNGLDLILITQFSDIGDRFEAYVGLKDESYFLAGIEVDKRSVSMFFEHEDVEYKLVQSYKS